MIVCIDNEMGIKLLFCLGLIGLVSPGFAMDFVTLDGTLTQGALILGRVTPAILAEVSCLSNAREARLLMTPEYRQFIAEALSTGIESYARELNRTSLRGS